MNRKNTLILLIAGIAIIVGYFLIKEKPVKSASTSTSTPVSANNSSAPMSVIPADKIEVVNFFGTQRCVSCLTIGRLSKQTIEEKFADEVKSGKIVFREINGELSENKDIVMKYQARGSSLFINAIRDDKDDIEEDVAVWRLVNNEAQFISYLEKKLNGLLGK